MDVDVWPLRKLIFERHSYWSLLGKSQEQRNKSISWRREYKNNYKIS
jgi:hypothetical protein